jgi:hypothetical protein
VPGGGPLQRGGFGDAELDQAWFDAGGSSSAVAGSFRLSCQAAGSSASLESRAATLLACQAWRRRRRAGPQRTGIQCVGRWRGRPGLDLVSRVFDPSQKSAD